MGLLNRWCCFSATSRSSALQGLQEKPCPAPESQNPWREPSCPGPPGREQLHPTSHCHTRLSCSTLQELSQPMVPTLQPSSRLPGHGQGPADGSSRSPSPHPSRINTSLPALPGLSSSPKRWWFGRASASEGLRQRRLRSAAPDIPPAIQAHSLRAGARREAGKRENKSQR